MENIKYFVVKKLLQDHMDNLDMGYTSIWQNGYEVRILQGMPRTQTVEKIFTDCPVFAQKNEMNINKHVYLFSE